MGDNKVDESKTKLPIILKGILNYKDVKIAIKHGIKNIWISNHGGRMLNSVFYLLKHLLR